MHTQPVFGVRESRHSLFSGCAERPWLGGDRRLALRGESAAAFGGGGGEEGGEVFVEGEELLDAGLVVGEGLGAIEALDGAVEALVGVRRSGASLAFLVGAEIFTSNI